MAQGARKIWGSGGSTTAPDTASASQGAVAMAQPESNRPTPGRSGGDHREAHQTQRQIALAETATAVYRSDGEAEKPNGAVTLDEANDLLVISEAGILLPSTEADWGDDVVSTSGRLSRTTATWAKEVLATEAESAETENEEPSAFSKESSERDRGEDASRQTVDWIDW